MNIDELKERSSKPFWCTLRRIYQATNCFLILLICVLIGVLVYHNPYCEPIPNLNWYQNSIIYETNKICSTESCDSFKNVTYFKSINTNALILTSLTNETIDKLKQTNIKIILNYAPLSNDQDNSTIQNLINQGVNAFNLMQIKSNEESLLSDIINIILDYNKANSNQKITLLLSSDQTNKLVNSSQYTSVITQFHNLTESLNNLDFNLLTSSNWIVDTTDPIKLILTVFLKGSKILNVNNLEETSTVYDELKKITELKSKFKTLDYGHIELNTNQSLIWLKRYFIADTTVVLIVNYDTQKTYDLNPVFSLFNLKDKILDISYFYAQNDHDNKLANVSKVKVDKKGNCVPNDLILPASSSLVISWQYVPPDFNDL